ncbi:MAG: hypothetical protein NT096_06680 [Proteobacteria bacterium]|nr:hypothetical protein [Pseudomonadota bacterium]
MSLLSESMRIAEKDFDLSRMFFKEYMNYNYTLNVMSESVKYPITLFILMPSSEENVGKKELTIAAKALYSDYKENDELTIFTALDTEDFL